MFYCHLSIKYTILIYPGVASSHTYFETGLLSMAENFHTMDNFYDTFDQNTTDFIITKIE